MPEMLNFHTAHPFSPILFGLEISCELISEVSGDIMKYLIAIVCLIKSGLSLIAHQGVFSHLTVQISPEVSQPTNCQSLFQQIEVRIALLNEFC